MSAGDDDATGARVGIVVVSHSRALAHAALALAQEMLHGSPVEIAVAAGLDETTLGTDAVAIKEAIEQVDSPAGVVVLMDLGSAVLSAELALELLDDPDVATRVLLSPAPIVEGLVVAAVTAAGGASRAEVAAEAQDALLAKLSQLGDTDEGGDPEPSADADADAGVESAEADEVVAVFTVANPHGLHARPAARLVAEVGGVDATVVLRNLTTRSGPVSAGSLSRVATLGALRDHEIEVRATGPAARAAADAVLALAARRFDEPDVPEEPHEPESSDDPSPGSPAHPLPASPGIAIGPARRMSVPTLDDDPRETGDPAAEWARVEEAVAQVRRDIEQLRHHTARDVGDAEAGIFEAHLALLGDAEMLADVEHRINEGGAGAFRAWTDTLAGVEASWSELDDPYLRERAADVRAVSDQVRRALVGGGRPEITAQGVLVAHDLTPAETAGLDLSLVQGIVLAAGSRTSHAAILSRSRGIPLVVAAGPGVLAVAEGTVLALDGGAGELVVDPDPDVLEDFRTRADAAALRRTTDLAGAQEPAQTRDGQKVTVAANLGSVDDAAAARDAGADAAGLVRTEFVFLGRDTAPDVEEQEQVYADIAAALGGRRITLRTLDVGGDKPLPYLDLPQEDNPFLGLRGLRLGLDRPGLLHDQLVAVCRTARRTPVSLMFPMVSTLSELLAAREVLEDAAGSEGLPESLRVGMMVEVPAAALKLASFVEHLDFVSIGTNDLTQYAMAAERGNPAVAGLSDPLDPGVLRLVDEVCRSAEGHCEVAVCGEAGSDEAGVALLLGLGVDELSVGPHDVPRVKALVRTLDRSACADLARQALGLADAAAVRALVAQTSVSSTLSG